jgi:hypothetical protein
VVYCKSSASEFSTFTPYHTTIHLTDQAGVEVTVYYFDRTVLGNGQSSLCMRQRPQLSLCGSHMLAIRDHFLFHLMLCNFCN